MNLEIVMHESTIAFHIYEHYWIEKLIEIKDKKISG